MTRLATEFSLFNKLKYGDAREIENTNSNANANTNDDNNNNPIEYSDNESNEDLESLNEPINEKLMTDIERPESFGKKNDDKNFMSIWWFKLLKKLNLIIGLCVITLLLFSTSLSITKNNSANSIGKNIVARPSLKILNENFVGNDNVREIFEVTYPGVVKPSFGKSLHSETLINHYFGDSWGKPAIVKYSPPSVKFNRVVLNLDTNSQGIQYDRLAHFFVGGVAIWRTSTLEPGGGKAHSNFVKDVSEYTSLFQSDQTMVYQLDNLTTDRLTGGFNITLTADYYYDESMDGDDGDDSILSILSTNSIPKIHGLGLESITNPNVYLPDKDFKFKFPKLNLNSTRLKLSIFTSGNADEEFWYSNVLNSNSKKFPGTELLGHGPIRTVIVKYNGKVIASEVPEPVIFTGGISPALWSPMVSMSAYDLLPIEFDLTSLIPHLKDDDEFEILVTNGGIDDAKIGQNWITSASLHVWENSLVKSSDDKSNSLNSYSKDSNTIVNTGWGEVFQLIEYSIKSNISSNIIYELTNGSTIDVNTISRSRDTSENVQALKENAEKQSVVSSTKFIKDVIFFDNKENILLFNTTQAGEYSLVLDLKTKISGNSTTFDVVVVKEKSTAASMDGEWYHSISNGQNGTSVFHLTPSGNYGTGGSETRYSLRCKPFDINYYRHVKVDNSGSVDYNYENFEGKRDCDHEFVCH